MAARYSAGFKDIEVHMNGKLIGHDRIIVLEVLDGYPTEDLVLDKLTDNFHDSFLYVGLGLHLIRSTNVFLR